MRACLPVHVILLRWAAAILMAGSACAQDDPEGRVRSRGAAVAVGPIGASDAERSGSKRVDEIDLEALTASSDFTVFMQPGVPDDVRVRALRKLWASDPIFNEVSPHE